MPTDVSRPEWRCDICLTRFGANLAAAQRCESAGRPVTLPDGELCLHYAEGYPGGRYQLITLRAVPQVKTRAATYNDDSGHLACYEAEGDTYENRNRVYGHEHLWPAVPGKLNVRHAHQSGLAGRGLRPATGARSAVTMWACTLARFPADAALLEDAGHSLAAPVRARPLTGAVAAVLDMLGASPTRLPSWDRHGLRDGAAAVIAAEQTALRDGLPPGSYDAARLALWLALQDPAQLRGEIEERQLRWRAGAHGSAPLPRLAARRQLSASKLSKAERAAVDATGVPWPPRTTAAEYANLLVRTTLGEPMTSITPHDDPRYLFATVPHRLAATSSKGGVGKTTAAAALAAALAADGHHVLLVDMNLTNPGQHIVWGLGPVDVDTQARLIRGQEIPLPPEATGTLRVFSHGQLAASPAVAQIEAGRAGEWLTFLAGALDLRDIGVIVFDLPPGWDNVHQHVLDKYSLALTGIVHVTTGSPLACQTEVIHGDGMPQRDTTPRWLVENLSRARGPVIGADGTEAEIRLYGTSDQPVRALASRLGITYAGSLPWQPDPRILAGTPEIRALARAAAGVGGSAPDAVEGTLAPAS